MRLPWRCAVPRTPKSSAGPQLPWPDARAACPPPAPAARHLRHRAQAALPGVRHSALAVQKGARRGPLGVALLAACSCKVLVNAGRCAPPPRSAAHSAAHPRAGAQAGRHHHGAGERRAGRRRGSRGCERRRCRRRTVGRQRRRGAYLARAALSYSCHSAVDRGAAEMRASRGADLAATEGCFRAACGAGDGAPGHREADARAAAPEPQLHWCGRLACRSRTVRCSRARF